MFLKTSQQKISNKMTTHLLWQVKKFSYHKKNDDHKMETEKFWLLWGWATNFFQSTQRWNKVWRIKLFGHHQGVTKNIQSPSLRWLKDFGHHPVVIENFQSPQGWAIKKIRSPPFVVAKTFWSPPFVVAETFQSSSDYEGVLDGNWKFLIAIWHTHTIGWWPKFFGHPRGKVGDIKKNPKW